MSSWPAQLNIAHISQRTHTLGPGERAVLWVKGCPQQCPSCIAPEWQSFARDQVLSIDDALDKLLEFPDINGLTFSGGEPFAQASALAELARKARERRELNIICFTGYSHEKLGRSPKDSGAARLLKQIDVLIDGIYIHELNDGIGLRGSNNQRIIHLTSRLKHQQLEHFPRKITIDLSRRKLLVTGIPPHNIGNLLEEIQNLRLLNNQKKADQ